MSLNIGFNGNVYDENGNAIDCKYQVHYVTQNIWNDVRDTDTQYYSANAGDGDSLTQDGSLAAGDVVLLTFWQGDGSGGATPADRAGNLYDRFAVHALVHDGSTSTYNIDVQLQPKQKPVPDWSLSGSETINRDITASDSSYDWMNWTYNNESFYHRQSYYGVIVFDQVGLLTTTYDWTDDNDAVTGYEDSNVHQYTVIGDYNPTIKVINAWSLENTDSKAIRIKYNKPYPDITFSPDGVITVIHTTETDTITAGINDEDNRITNIDHHWKVLDRNDGTTISDDLIASNTTLDYSYDETIQVLQRHLAEQIISWNDGYDDLTIIYSEELHITNWLPLVNFNLNYVNDKTINFVPNCSDIDGTVDGYKWELYVLVPFSTDGYTLAKTIVDTVGDDQEITFDSDGHYKMVLTATDDYGESASFEKEFDVSTGGTCDDVSLGNDMFFMFRPNCK